MTGPAPLVHGTRAMYRRGGCRQECCRAAMRAYDKRRRALLNRGLTSMVDAAPVRTHLLWLAGYGIGPYKAAKKAGIPVGVVERLLYGSPATGKQPSTRIRRSNAEALLAIQRTLGNVTDLARTPARETITRLRELVAAGWSQSELARRLDMSVAQLNKHLLGRHDHVSGRFARAVRDLHTTLTATAPPQATPGQKAAISHALRVAHKRGWTTPTHTTKDAS